MAFSWVICSVLQVAYALTPRRALRRHCRTEDSSLIAQRDPLAQQPPAPLRDRVQASISHGRVRDRAAMRHLHGDRLRGTRIARARPIATIRDDALHELAGWLQRSRCPEQYLAMRFKRPKPVPRPRGQIPIAPISRPAAIATLREVNGAFALQGDRIGHPADAPDRRENASEKHHGTKHARMWGTGFLRRHDEDLPFHATKPGGCNALQHRPQPPNLGQWGNQYPGSPSSFDE